MSTPESLIPVPASDLRRLIAMAHNYVTAVPDELMNLSEEWDADEARLTIIRSQALLDLE